MLYYNAQGVDPTNVGDLACMRVVQEADFCKKQKKGHLPEIAGKAADR